MLDILLITLNPTLVLFVCIAVGFILRKTNILGDESAKVLAKLETWVFLPALNFATMSEYFTKETLSTHATNVILTIILTIIAIFLAIILSRFFYKENCYEKNVYQYALTFANFGYMGAPLVLAVFGDVGYSYYALVNLPLWMGIYTWGMTRLIPTNEEKGSALNRMFNAPMIAMLLGMIFGITGLGNTFRATPILSVVTSTVESLKTCMGPVAMLLAGITIAKFGFVKMLKNKKVYLASFFRLILIPAIILVLAFGLKEFANLIFGLSIDNSILFLLFFAFATPLGLNTIVFPEAYGKSAEEGASMALVSHTLSVITLSVLYMLLVLIVGSAPNF